LHHLSVAIAVLPWRALHVDALKQQLLRIQQQLSGLSASQKMLTGALVVIMVMTMSYWARYAGTAEMEALLDQAMSAEDISRIKSVIASKGISYTVTGERIMVPKDRKQELLADLSYAQVLPRDMKDAFEEIVLGNHNPFDSDKQKEQLINFAREKKLATIISMWPSVKSATVMIDGSSKRNPMRSIEPRASVAVTMKPGDSGTKKLADAVTNLVAGAIAGLRSESIMVTIDGKAWKQADPNNPMSGDDNPILATKSRYESYYADKILKQLTWIPSAYATVSVDLNTKSQTIIDKVVDPKGKVEALLSQSTTAEENTAGAPGGEPGANANMGMTIDGGGGSPGQNSTRETTDIKNLADISVKNTSTNAPAGDAVAVAASVRVPDSYFISIWKRQNPGSTTEPSAADLDALVTSQLPAIRADVRMATNIKDDTAISVARYIDVSEPLTGGEAAAAGLASLPTGFGFGAKEIAIGVLAIVSLFMVSMMVRKSIPQPVVQTAMASGGGEAKPSSPGSITAIAELAGVVGEGGVLLPGRELSDGDMEAQQVIEQVGTMVKENPDAAANLVKRWLNQE